MPEIQYTQSYLAKPIGSVENVTDADATRLVKMKVAQLVRVVPIEGETPTFPPENKAVQPEKVKRKAL